VLYVGSEQRRKNLPSLIAGLAQHRKQERDLVFVKAGDPQSDLGRRKFFSALRANEMEEATMLLQGLSEDQMVKLYRAADIFAFPSVEEGWGVPVLEAMASGVPVLSSRIAPVVEFAGDTVLYTDDPYSPHDWSSKLAELGNNISLRQHLSTAGRRRALEFSWDRARSRFAAGTQLGQPQ
jgi:glycosyltransferase involved in cell wall biosynthesis